LTAREAALRALVEVERGRGARDALDGVLGGGAPLPAADRSLATELVYGVTRRRLTLDGELARLLTGRGPSDLTPWVRNAIRLGLYQMRYLRVPAYAAVYDAVEQCRRHGHAGVAALCNAVLRRAQRQPAPEPESLAVATSHPAWLVERWMRRFGPEEARRAAPGGADQPAADHPGRPRPLPGLLRR
jgi:16S rRNA (cytosine967-C5)-methyltransferase